MALVLSGIVNAQVKKAIAPANADCAKAIEIKDTIYGPTSPPEKFGEKLEITEADKKSLLYIEEEHHTVWYRFKCPCNGKLTFEIVPESVTDDYDFLLFKTDGKKGFCDRIATKEIKPIRTNIARNDKKLKSRTGLSLTAKADFVHSGPGQGFSKYVDVTKGNTFYLLVDNVYNGGKGHTVKIKYHCDTTKAPAPPAKAKPVVINGVTQFNIDEVKVGETFVLDNINFYPNTSTVMPESEPELRNLLAVMRKYPTLKIQVQGHVDGPLAGNNPFFQGLSEDRAEAIANFLINSYVDMKRVAHAGFGNKQMIYINPQTEDEHKANRRVEIKILAK